MKRLRSLIEPGRAAGLVLAFCLFVLAGCAPPVLLGPAAEKPGEAVLLKRLADLDAEFRSLKGLARITYRFNGAKKSADHVVLVEHPDKLRLETLGLFGAPAMLAATDGSRSVVLFPGEGQAYVGPAQGDFLRKVTRLPLTPKMAVAIMLRRPDILRWQTSRVSYRDNGISTLALQDNSLRQEIDFDGDLQIVRVAYYADERLLSNVRYEEYSNGFPGRLILDFPLEKLDVEIEYRDIETNVGLDTALFRLVPTDAYQINPFPDNG